MINPWFKFYGSEYLSDLKINQLTPNERSCWITILCHASQTKDGVIKFLSEKQLLKDSGVTTKIAALSKFESLDMIEVCNGDVTVKNWTKRQYSESLNRVREFRKRSGNGDVTTEEKRIEKKREEEIRLPDFLNIKVWIDWVQYRKEKKSKLTPSSIKSQLKFLSENQKDHVAIIEKSIQNGWAGLFPLKVQNSKYSGNEFTRDKEKFAARVEEIDYETKLKLDNEITRVARGLKIK